MKKSTGIAAIQNRTSFSKKMLKKFVNTRPPNGWKSIADKKGHKFSANYENIDWSSTHLPIDGTLTIIFDANHPESISRISIPVQSAFIVTCTKQPSDHYKITWSCSLS
jgi:hypothetical protein